MIFWHSYTWYIDPAAYGILTPHRTHLIPNPLLRVFWFDSYGILSPSPMGLWHPYPWYIEPLAYSILTPYPLYIEHPDNLTSLPMAYWTPYLLYFYPLPMVYRTLCVWNIKHPTHSVLNPLPMVFWPSS
jgi:hypothetical protein